MSLNLRGRIRNTSVPQAHAFLPLFEAVINSLHATEDRFGDRLSAEGKIEVRIDRLPAEPTLPGIPGRPPIRQIASVTVTDNGCGFTDENMQSFATADTTAKAQRGGKGVGRFSWLVVFEEARIESTFEKEDGERVARAFRFVPSDEGIEDYTSRTTKQPVSTSVRLSGVRSRYDEPLRMGSDAIADRLFEHCFNYFVLDRCPAITLIDDGSEEPIRINDRILEVVCSDPVSFKVGTHELQLRHVERKYSAGRKHEGHLCANERVVESFALVSYCDLNPEPYVSESGETVVHHAFVTGKALDAAVDASRTRLDLPDGSPLLERAGELDLKALREQVGAQVDDRLADVLKAEREENLKRIATHIRTSQPEYRHLITQQPEALSRVHWTSDSVKLDEQLYRVQQQGEAEVRRRQQALEEDLTNEDADPERLGDDLAKIITEVNQQGQANLVRYVAKRRAVLKLLERLISVTSGPALENRVHRVVFPLRTTADEIGYDDHNLWLVDDTLSFYEFVASDKPLSQMQDAPSDSARRPDLLAFKTGDPYQHVAIVEFKRPDREDENPVQQLVDYALLLRDGGAKNAKGITMTGVPRSVRIDSYAICTLTPALEEAIRRGPGNMTKVAEEGRWYGSVPAENLWIEVLDFQAFIRRAEQRNRAFFTKLGLS